MTGQVVISRLFYFILKGKKAMGNKGELPTTPVQNSKKSELYIIHVFADSAQEW
jgi:hypothetical protein